MPGGHIRSLAATVAPEVHQNLIDTEGLRVDEDNWFLFFRKDRWWVSSALAEDPPGGQQWSVDDPGVWSVLRLAIELADRIITTLMKERHPL